MPVFFKSIKDAVVNSWIEYLVGALLFTPTAILSMLFFFVAFAQTSAQTPKEDSNVIEKFKIAKDGKPILLPIDVGGKKVPFLVDTSSSETCFDKSLITEPKPPLNLGGVGAFDAKRQGLNAINVPESWLGKKRLGDYIVTTLSIDDLEGMRQRLGCDVRGILGLDYLSHKIVQIDFDAGELRFLKRTHKELGKEISFESDDTDIPKIKLHLDKFLKAKFILDTTDIGTTSGQLGETLVHKIVDSELGYSFKERDFLFHSPGGVIDQVRCNSLSIQGHVVKKPIFFEVDKINKLSLYFLSRFVVTFDFPANKLYLKPGKNFDKPDLYDLSGLYIRTNSGCVLAQAIDKDSVADKAGMKEGDILTRLDGQDIAKIELFDVRKRFCEDGTRIKLRVKRAEKELEFTLILKSFETKK
jgi:hypothetical protein